MKTIAVVTGARSDFGIWLPVLRAVAACDDLRLRLLVCGMHLAPEFGNTVEAIRAEGFEPDECIETLLASDSPQAVSKSMGLAMTGFAQSYARERPDILLLLGDRTEMFAAAAAALPFAIPMAHVHGGETTEGAIDEALRHSITKMSHLHFVATEEYGRRVRQLGENPDRVFVTGAPALDLLSSLSLLDKAALEIRLGLPLNDPPLLVTLHPTTLDWQSTGDHATALMTALDRYARPIIFTYPNADTCGRTIIDAIDGFVAGHDNAVAVTSLGSLGYFSLMTQAAAMIGNSSSGLIEAASFQLPVVNIGDRQKGRLRGANVIDCAPDADAIGRAIDQALAPGFRQSLAGLVNPYGRGNAAQQIVAILRSRDLGPELLRKTFHDLAV